MSTADRFFVDAECDGLYGPFLSVAALVTDPEGRELDRFYGAVRSPRVREPWVRKHVLPSLGRAERFFPTEEALLEGFWTFWEGHRAHCICIADVCCPVEARLFARCVRRAPEERTALAPFPLFDLSTLLLARGLDPLAERETLSGLPLTAHDALNDVRMSAALWQRLI